MNIILLSFIKENPGSFIFIVLFVIIVVWAAFWFGGWRCKVNSDLNDLDVARKGFGGLSEKVNGMSNRINDIWGFLTGRASVRSESPLSLTPLGLEISVSIDAKKITEKYFKIMLAAEESTAILNAFEIQTISMDFAKSKLLLLLSKEEKDQVEDEAFQRGMILPGVLDVIGIELRDFWLKKVGLDVSQVDNKDDQD